MARYDIFISYRRSAFESAQLIASSLKAAGYNVFIDVESLRSGKFNEQLYRVIDGCKDFVLILPQGALDRCESEGDWVRLESMRAMAQGKNIIPVMLTGFTWKDPMPKGMEELKNYQAITASSSEFFDLSMKRLASYLKSRSHAGLKKTAIWIATIIMGLFFISFVAESVITRVSLPLYTRVADNLTLQTSVLSLLGDDNDNIEKIWNNCLDHYHKLSDPTLLQDLYSDIETDLDNELKSLNPLRDQLQTTRLELSGMEVFQLGLRGINVEEVLMCYPSCEFFFSDIENEVNLIREIIKDGVITLLEEKTVKESFDVFRHCSNAHYYGFLSILSLFPEKALDKYNKLRVDWHHFPNGVGLNHSEDEFNAFIEYEYNLVRESNYDLSNRLLSIKQNYEESLADYQKIVGQYVELYENILKDATASPDSDPFVDWIKIVQVASFLPDIIATENDPESFSLPLKTDKVGEDISHLLDLYATAHPDYRLFLDGAKNYYMAMARQEQPYQGFVVVSVTGVNVDVIKSGAIVTKINSISTIPDALTDIMKILNKYEIKQLSMLAQTDSGAWNKRDVDFDNKNGKIVLFPLVMEEL